MKKHLCVALSVSVLAWIAGTLSPIRLAAQAESATQTTAAAGQEATLVWGGEHIEMKQNASGAEVQFDCATGTIAGPLKVDARGKFQADGTYKREHGGPVRKDENGAVAAKYSGSITGDTMRLDIVLTQSKESVGSYVLTRGQAGKVFKCK